VPVTQRTAASETTPAAPPRPAARTADGAPFSDDARPPIRGPQPLPDPLAPHNEARAARIKTNRLADQVYDLIVRRLEDERMRRGL
jgi:hypothetical protein